MFLLHFVEWLLNFIQIRLFLLNLGQKLLLWLEAVVFVQTKESTKAANFNLVSKADNILRFRMELTEALILTFDFLAFDGSGTYQ